MFVETSSSLDSLGKDAAFFVKVARNLGECSSG